MFPLVLVAVTALVAKFFSTVLFWFTESMGKPSLRCNVKALNDHTYKLVGEMLATAVVQGGPLPRLFSNTCSAYLIKLSTEIDCPYTDLPELERVALEKVMFS